MRLVRIATWTSGEPVSPSVVAYSSMIFFLASFAAASTDTQFSSRFPVARRPRNLERGAPGVRGSSYGSAADQTATQPYQRRGDSTQSAGRRRPLGILHSSFRGRPPTGRGGRLECRIRSPWKRDPGEVSGGVTTIPAMTEQKIVPN